MLLANGCSVCTFKIGWVSLHFAAGKTRTDTETMHLLLVSANVTELELFASGHVYGTLVLDVCALIVKSKFFVTRLIALHRSACGFSPQ